MSMPIIAGAMLFLGLDAFAEGFTKVPLAQMLAAVVVSALSAYATIALFIGLLARIGMMPFVWYRLALGLLLVLVIIFGS
jgi:undecaprenyl-diphosphatase